MRKAHTFPIANSLPLVLAAMAIACSSNDEPRPAISESRGAAVAENADGSPPPMAASADADQETPDEDTVLDDTRSNDASPNEIGSGEAAASDDLDNDRLPDSV
ncbi:MAG TPA: hypothetical protein VIV60_23390, partial [Polyangiaceae bacterium]